MPTATHVFTNDAEANQRTDYDCADRLRPTYACTDTRANVCSDASSDARTISFAVARADARANDARTVSFADARADVSANGNACADLHANIWSDPPANVPSMWFGARARGIFRMSRRL